MASSKNELTYFKLVSSCNTTVKGLNTLSKFRITQDSLSNDKFQFSSNNFFISFNYFYYYLLLKIFFKVFFGYLYKETKLKQSCLSYIKQT